MHQVVRQNLEAMCTVQKPGSTGLNWAPRPTWDAHGTLVTQFWCVATKEPSLHAMASLTRVHEGRGGF